MLVSHRAAAHSATSDVMHCLSSNRPTLWKTGLDFCCWQTQRIEDCACRTTITLSVLERVAPGTSGVVTMSVRMRGGRNTIMRHEDTALLHVRVMSSLDGWWKQTGDAVYSVSYTHLTLPTIYAGEIAGVDVSL